MLLRKRSEGSFDKPSVFQGTAGGICSPPSNGAGQFFYSGGRLIRRRGGRNADDRLDADRRNDYTVADEQNGYSDDQRSSSGYSLAVASSDVTTSGWKPRPSKATEAANLLSLLNGESGVVTDVRDIVIHVCDEAKRIRKDFSCNQEVLLTHMKYFESYLSGVKNGDDVDISVHCDVGVFEWLVEYMKNPSKVDTLDAQNVVSILISSNFLQMDRLVEKCLALMKESINQVLRVPIDLTCISNELVRRLASLFSDEDLELVRDRRDRLTSRLYAHKLEGLLGDQDNMLHCCVFCGCLFTMKQREQMVCPKAENFIDFHGNLIAQHVADADWDVSQYIQHCRETLQLPWRDIYWRIWGKIQTLHCTTCDCFFPASELNHCLYHPEEPMWHTAPRAHEGVYPCCQQSVLRFGASLQKIGCRAREHVVGSVEGAAILEKMMRYRAMVCVSDEEREKHAPLVADTSDDVARSSEKQEGTVDPSTVIAEDDEDRRFEDDEDERSISGSDEGGEVTYSGDEATWEYGDDGKPSFLYCFDPPPEHRAPLSEWKALRSSSTDHSRRITSGRCRSQESSSNVADASHSASILGLPARGGSPWPSPATEASPSFFRLRLPPEMQALKRQAFKLDMLREDDRRRMDALTSCIRSRNREANISTPCRKEVSLGGKTKVKQEANPSRFGSLAWLGDVAAAKTTSAVTSRHKGNKPTSSASSTRRNYGVAVTNSSGSSAGVWRPRKQKIREQAC